MKAQLVLIEKEDKIRNTVFGCSGLMLDNKYVITTGYILLEEDQNRIFADLEPGKLYPDLFSSHKAPLNVVWRENELYVVKRASYFSAYISKNIQKSSKHIFQNWAIDSIDNNRNLQDSLSPFFILTFEGLGSVEDFKRTLNVWRQSLGNFDISKGDTIYTKSVPFGNRHFIDSYSRGIVSNICGNNSCLILSDCPSSPGSEGSPVYLSDCIHLNLEVPIGLVLASLSWWKGEWVGLTLLVDIRPIILEIIDVPTKICANVEKADNSKMSSTTDFSLVQVYCGSNRGTAILLNQEKGIFITNSHVVEDACKPTNIICVLRNNTWNVNLVYRTPKDDVFDLAIIKCDPNIIKQLNLKSIRISKKSCKIGVYVYSAGFSLFSKECQPSPILSKGYISQSNPFMIKTTCSVHPGASGGAILDDECALAGIIVCNLRYHHTVYTRVNMAVPFSAVENVINKYVDSGDVSVLNKLHMKNNEAEIIWKRLEGKL